MDPEYTELGIKIHKFRFTLRVQRRTPTPSEDGRSTRSRTPSTASSIADSLGLLNLEPPRSRRPIATNSNWEFYPMRTSTPSSGYNSTASVSRASSFSSKRLTSTDDSAYSEVYSTIEELSELQDPFDEEQPQPQKPQKQEAVHQKSASSSSTIAANSRGSNNSTLRKMPPKPAPPLPPRITASRPPARPPYPSTHVKQKSM